VRVVVFLLLGAVVNVAVAWGFKCWPPSSGGESSTKWRDDIAAWWYESSPVGFEGDLVEMEWVEIVGYQIADVDGSQSASGYKVWVQRQRQGWPLLCLESANWVSSRTHRSPRRRHVVGIAVTMPEVIRIGSAEKLLPTRAVWPGFAINTLFYAIVLWLLFAAPFALRRWRRVRRGLCAHCAYPVGASDVCTECGARVSSRVPGVVA